jgi:hypothetical protein
MTAEQQLDYVYQYFVPYRGRLSTLADVYMAVLWPAAIGQPNSYTLFSFPSTAYQQNRGLDANSDGKVTKQEAVNSVQTELTRGWQYSAY